MRHIRELDDAGELPEVGRYYLVDCVRIMGADGWYPVFGGAHRDPELGVADLHLHNDTRFVSDRLVYPMAGYTAAETLLGRVSVLESDWRAIYVVEERAVKRRRCVRATHACYPAYSRFAMPTGENYRKMQNGFAGHVLGDTCPHRGFPRSCMPIVEHEGRRVRVCPGHGLRFDAETGELVQQ